MDIPLPERLILARNRLQWSQSDLAERSGFQPSAISHFETGKRCPSVENLVRLADTLRVSTDWLLGRMLEDHAMYRSAKSIMQSLVNMPKSDQEAVTLMAQLLSEKKIKKHSVGCTGE